MPITCTIENETTCSLSLSPIHPCLRIMCPLLKFTLICYFSSGV
uniref:Uncharacterized protein n=1 Tax=Anguilla anguilla TaxID=7936 RepID=A0A0E9RF66_ANGAN